MSFKTVPRRRTLDTVECFFIWVFRVWREQADCWDIVGFVLAFVVSALAMAALLVDDVVPVS